MPARDSPCLEEKCDYIECKRSAWFPSYSCVDEKKKLLNCLRRVKTKSSLVAYQKHKDDVQRYFHDSTSK